MSAENNSGIHPQGDEEVHHNDSADNAVQQNHDDADSANRQEQHTSAAAATSAAPAPEAVPIKPVRNLQLLGQDLLGVLKGRDRSKYVN